MNQFHCARGLTTPFEGVRLEFPDSQKDIKGYFIIIEVNFISFEIQPAQQGSHLRFNQLSRVATTAQRCRPPDQTRKD